MEQDYRKGQRLSYNFEGQRVTGVVTDVEYKRLIDLGGRFGVTVRQEPVVSVTDENGTYQLTPKELASSLVLATRTDSNVAHVPQVRPWQQQEVKAAWVMEREAPIEQAIGV